MELPFAGLHQLCAPMLDRLDALPEPQQAALGVALGPVVGTGPGPLPGRAGHAEPAGRGRRRAPAAVLRRRRPMARRRLGAGARLRRAAAARRVGGDRVRGARTDRRARAGGPARAGARGLPDEDARALLATVIPGRLDERVRDRLVAETRGNPLAILELPRGLAATQLPGAFGLQETHALSGRIEESFLRRLDALPDEARLLLLVAAAEPVDDPPLCGARPSDSASASAAVADEAEGLLAIGERVTFLHPLVRSAVYRSASLHERQSVHSALAEATDAAGRPGPPRVASRARRRRPRTRTSPANSSTPRAARRLAAGSARRRRSSSGPPRCRRTHRDGPTRLLAAADAKRARRCVRRRAATARARSTPRRSTSSERRASSCCADRSPSTSAAPVTRRRCCCRRGKTPRDGGHAAWLARPTSRRSAPRCGWASRTAPAGVRESPPRPRCSRRRRPARPPRATCCSTGSPSC